ncbi:hypothetical protein ACLB2K_072820 [Fragaria x ananassa]
MPSASSENNLGHHDHEAATYQGTRRSRSLLQAGKLGLCNQQGHGSQNPRPNLPYINNFITAYRIHKAVSEKKSWCEVLGLPKTADSQTIKKQYKELALVVHPDKNSSLAAGGAFRHVKTAWDLLSDPKQKEDYDKSLSRRGSGIPFPHRNPTQFHRYDDDNDYYGDVQRAGCKNKPDRTNWKPGQKSQEGKDW